MRLQQCTLHSPTNQARLSSARHATPTQTAATKQQLQARVVLHHAHSDVAHGCPQVGEPLAALHATAAAASQLCSLAAHAAHACVVARDGCGHSVVPVAALVAAAEVVDAQHVVADDVPQEDAVHLAGKTHARTAVAENSQWQCYGLKGNKIVPIPE